MKSRARSRSSRNSRSSARICAWLETSSPETISSATTSRGLQCDGPRDPDALALAARQLVGIARAVARAQRHPLQQGVHPPACLGARLRPAVQAQRLGDDVGHPVPCGLSEDCGSWKIIWELGSQRAEPFFRQVRDVPAVEPEAAGGGGVEADQGPPQAGFAGAALADDAQGVAGRSARSMPCRMSTTGAGPKAGLRRKSGRDEGAARTPPGARAQPSVRCAASKASASSCEPCRQRLGHRLQQLAGAVVARRRGHERPGVRVARRLDDPAGVARFQHPPAVQHRHFVADLGDHARSWVTNRIDASSCACIRLMRASTWRCTVTSSAVVGSSRDDELRAAGEGDGDQHALAHAAGQLVRILAQHPVRSADVDVVEQLPRPGAARRLRPCPGAGAAHR